MSLDNDEYRQLFIEEAKEHIDTIIQSMLTLEKEPSNQEIVNMLFRSAHTLKGSSGMMGFKDFQELTHAMEDVFDDMRKGNHPSSNLISVLLECVDALSQRLENIQNKVESEIEVLKLKSKLQATKLQEITAESQEKTQTAANPESTFFSFTEQERRLIQQSEAIGEKCFLVDSRFSDDCSFKSIRASMILDKIADIAKVVKTNPVNEEFDEQRLSRGFKIAVISKFDEETIQNCAKQVLEVESVNVTMFNASDSTLFTTSDLSAKESIPPLHPENNYSISVENGKITKIIADTQSSQTVRVKFDQLDKLMNWVGELVINKIALLQVTTDSRSESLKRITENIDRLTADLQDLVMQVRMVPVSQIFDRFPRLVRDLSLKKGKKIELVMEGREIEVDRTVLDEIGEPLIHLLRNSIDHGIEMPDEREAAKKTATGVIRLSAQRNGDHVIIEVADDGLGIDVEKIKKSAIKKSFATEAELEKMTSDQIMGMIFKPGFSTANEVSETSGRGVGMDVVKTKISGLGGSVHLETDVGKGTKFIIRLPLTLAIIQAILVNDTMQTFAIPTSQVCEIVQVRKKDVKSLGSTKAIVVRNHVIPLVHLHSLLSFNGEDEENLELLVVYVGDESNKIGLAVDCVLRQQDILVKTLNETLQGIKGINGATILGDGQVVLLLDIGQLLSRMHKRDDKR